MINKYTDMPFEELEVKNSVTRITLEHIGEGYNGDFDDTDPDDARLIRFSIDRKKNGYWEGIEDASYCTQITIASPRGQLANVARSILTEVTDTLKSGYSIKTLCERLSWIEV